MVRAFAEIVFTASVRALQEEYGSYEIYGRMFRDDAKPANRLTDRETQFLSSQDGFYQATVSQNGWPYVQFRGGHPGFIKIIGERTIAYADFRGNRQYLSVGNLKGEKRIALIFVDYANQRRLKIWGTAQVIDGKTDAGLVAELHVDGYCAVPERAIVITVAAFDWNCPQHIPLRLTPEEFQAHGSPLQDEIDRLTIENRRLATALSRHTARSL